MAPSVLARDRTVMYPSMYNELREIAEWRQEHEHDPTSRRGRDEGYSCRRSARVAAANVRTENPTNAAPSIAIRPPSPTPTVA